MQQLFKRLEALLNTQTSDPLFAQFLKEIGERPVVEPGNDALSYYRFFSSGFSLSVNSDGKLRGALVLIDDEATRAGLYKPFQQSLPCGIVPGDRCSAIESKLDLKPLGVHKGVHMFRLPTHFLMCKFDAKMKTRG